MAFPLINPRPDYTPGGTLEFRNPATNAFVDTYPTADDADAATNANDNPLILDSLGRGSVYLPDGASARVIHKDSTGRTVWTEDDVESPYSQETYNQGSTGAINRSISDKIGDVVSVKDFGATGDGVTSDHTAFVDALASGNDVYIPPGDYLVDGAAFAPSSEQTIFGSGDNSKLLKITAATAFTENFFDLGSAVSVTIKDLSFRKQSGTSQYLATIEGGSDFRFLNCHSTGDEADGVFIFKNSSDVLIDGCIFEDGKFGVATGGDSAGNTNGSIERVTISNNIFRDTATEAIDINWDTHKVLITGNQFFNCCTAVAEEVIDVGGGVSPNHCTDITITNNIIDLTTSTNVRGIRIKDATSATERFMVTDNTIYRSTIAASGSNVIGIFVEIANDGVISNNYIENCERGIAFSDSGCVDVVVSGNTIKNIVKDGILLSGAGTHERIAITGNVVNGSNAEAVEQLISVEGPSTDITISSNILEGVGTSAAGDGILVNDATCTRINISDNIIKSTGQGIGLVSGIAGVKVTGNQIYDCWTDGIDCGATPVNLMLSHNQIWDCDKADAGTACGITVTTPDTMSINGNMVYDSRSGVSRTLDNGIRINTSGVRVTYVGNSCINLVDAESIASLTVSVNASNNVTDVP